MLCYKIVHKRVDGVLVSLYIRGQHAITYTPGVLLDHPNMFVFETFRDAVIKWGRNSEEIWECETSELREPMSKVLNAFDINRFYNQYWQGEDVIRLALYPTPFGTMLCNDLKLVRRLRPV